MEQSVFKEHCDRLIQVMDYHAQAVKGVYIAGNEGNVSAGKGWSKHASIAKAELNEILALFSEERDGQEQANKNLVTTINYLNEILNIKSNTISDLQQQLNERD